MSLSSRTWNEVTARPITPGVTRFIEDLLEHFENDERIADAIRAEGTKGNYGHLLSRVRDRLAREDAIADRRAMPQVEISGPELMAVVRGETAPPEPPFTYESRGLSRAEYSLVLAWAGRRRGLA